MTSAQPLHDELTQQLKICGRQIAGTLTVGVVACALAVFGQNALMEARPIFPFIEQTYTIWQVAYGAFLILAGLAWAYALLQRINGWQECQHRLKTLRRIDEQKEQRARRAEEIRREREQAYLSTLQTTSPTFKNSRSKKFDY